MKSVRAGSIDARARLKTRDGIIDRKSLSFVGRQGLLGKKLDGDPNDIVE